ncbi:low temperature requirement protein A [Solwaraspora sp. WMMD792]|uniref:low temperature requirement protein A n=1 Tax=Solwaraspora sp. WMMD792 TaxID=3016099 RepID=UPI002415CA94|nr:low temperature requirement protein A [Solwaraspora sp. WMMD792]MDG4770566.1 low temperature requirement protein A [Solwaraspora sp. WMMD792]
MEATKPTSPVMPAAPGMKVSRLELFYDLVFVFAFIHVTTASVEDLEPFGLVAIFLLLAVLWLVWSRFALLGNNLRADWGIMPIHGFTIMAIVFISVATLPGLGDEPPQAQPGVPQVIPGEFIFPTCYLLIWLLEAAALRVAARTHPELLGTWWRDTPVLAASTALLFVAAVLPLLGWPGEGVATLLLVWTLGVGVAYLTTVRLEPFAVVSAGHWTERHAQIVLIGFGEALLSLGLGSGAAIGAPGTVPVITATLLGIALICALWWAYFDTRSYAAEQVLHHTHGLPRDRLARDGYTLLHLPMLFGIILLSLGLKQTLAYLAGTASTGEDAPLEPIHLRALYGGVLLYLVALSAFQLRTVRSVAASLAVPVLLLAALLPVVARIPAFAALLLLTAITVAGVAADSRRAGASRHRLREHRLAEQQALEREESGWRRRHG